MHIFLKTKVALASLILYSAVSYAQQDLSSETDSDSEAVSDIVTVIGSQTVTIPTDPTAFDNNEDALSLEDLTGIKTIQLMDIIPSYEMTEQNKKAIAEMIAAGGEKDYSKGIIPFNKSKGAVDIGMANVPVLDQGAYGTCVTFAATAALDARLKKGDYIDQQCSLALNKGLGHNYWNGANNATQILSPLKKYGIISKGNCFGVKYPSPSQTVSAKTYQTKSNKSYSGSINYAHIIKANQSVVKKAIKAGLRVAIGTALANNGDAISVNGFDMLIDGKKTRGGLWACQQPKHSFNYCSQQKAGHEIVIIGYDDKQELFKIRNSWGTKIGENGNYYMSYRFFNAMVWDQTIVK